MNANSRAFCAAVAVLVLTIPNYAQSWAKPGVIIGPTDLPGELATSLRVMGSRLTSLASAATSVSGSLVDSTGTMQVQLVVQAPGLLHFQDSNSRTLSYDGSQWQATNGKGGQNDTRIQESLLAHFPDSVFLQIANGGGLRKIGNGFRTDNGKTPNYTGPFWTIFAYSPGSRPGLASGQALQQNCLVAIDEKTGLLSEIRIVSKAGSASRQVVQTKFSNWVQQSGQWYPGQIVRLENGQQVLSFTNKQGGTGTQLPTSTFQH